MNNTFKFILANFNKSDLNKLLLLTLLLAGLMACQRNNMPYGGVKENSNAPKYTEQVDVNSQKLQK